MSEFIIKGKEGDRIVGRLGFESYTYPAEAMEDIEKCQSRNFESIVHRALQLYAILHQMECHSIIVKDINDNEVKEIVL